MAIKHHIFCEECNQDMTLTISDEQLRDEVDFEGDHLRPMHCPFCSSEHLETYNEELENGDLL
jgi:hypothetical protein|tara:strand:- start:351 stop:539 length:189 start_codon:yes stop_codon:yes gene_type:complete